MCFTGRVHTGVHNLPVAGGQYKDNMHTYILNGATVVSCHTCKYMHAKVNNCVVHVKLENRLFLKKRKRARYSWHSFCTRKCYEVSVLPIVSLIVSEAEFGCRKIYKLNYTCMTAPLRSLITFDCPCLCRACRLILRICSCSLMYTATTSCSVLAADHTHFGIL